MDEKEIIRALKSERCPPSVLKQVKAAIRSEKPSITGWRWSMALPGILARRVVSDQVNSDLPTPLPGLG